MGRKLRAAIFLEWLAWGTLMALAIPNFPLVWCIRAIAERRLRQISRSVHNRTRCNGGQSGHNPVADGAQSVKEFLISCDNLDTTAQNGRIVGDQHVTKTRRDALLELPVAVREHGAPGRKSSTQQMSSRPLLTGPQTNPLPSDRPTDASKPHFSQLPRGR
jgi:hypothetical protein